MLPYEWPKEGISISSPGMNRGDAAGEGESPKDGPTNLPRAAVDQRNVYDDYMQDVVRRTRDDAERNHEEVDDDRKRYLDELTTLRLGDGGGPAPMFPDRPAPAKTPEDAAKAGASSPSFVRRAFGAVASIFSGKGGGR